MKICLVHNSYEQRGGEDVVAEQERNNLRRHGHHVVVYRRSNSEIRDQGLLTRISLAKNAVWSADSRKEFADLIEGERPDVVHVHNTFFMISPSIYSVCKERGIPVVQTLHNYRLVCPAHMFFRDGNVCEDCLSGGLWNGILHRCYRESAAATGLVATILSWHRLLKTWRDCIDCYVALTEFARKKFISAGFPAEKIVVKPNFVEIDPGPRTTCGDYALFVGRITPEKGVEHLLSAWDWVPSGRVLQIIGDGPELGRLQEQVRRRKRPNVRFLGSLSRAETIACIKGARFLIVPSLWYEGFPMVIAEAMACGTPILCSRIGAMEEIVSDGETGLHFSPGDIRDMASRCAWAWRHPHELKVMGMTARNEFERRYTADLNYAALMKIYKRVLAHPVTQSHPVVESSRVPQLISN